MFSLFFFCQVQHRNILMIFKKTHSKTRQNFHFSLKTITQNFHFSFKTITHNLFFQCKKNTNKYIFKYYRAHIQSLLCIVFAFFLPAHQRAPKIPCFHFICPPCHYNPPLKDCSYLNKHVSAPSPGILCLSSTSPKSVACHISA